MRKAEFVNIVTHIENALVESNVGYLHTGLCGASRRGLSVYDPVGYENDCPKFYDTLGNIRDSIAYYFRDNDDAYWLGKRWLEENYIHRAMVIYLWEQIILDSGEYKQW